jgi:hypothetical protein
MSGTYGPADDAESDAAGYATREGESTLIRTGDWYGMGQNELRSRWCLP